MFEILGSIGLFGIIGFGFFSGRWAKGLLGVILTMLAYGLLGGMVSASVVSIGFLVYMIKSNGSL